MSGEEVARYGFLDGIVLCACVAAINHGLGSGDYRVVGYASIGNSRSLNFTKILNFLNLLFDRSCASIILSYSLFVLML